MELKTEGQNIVITLSKDELDVVYGQCKKDERYYDGVDEESTIMINFIKSVEKEVPELAW